jgi:hypothetical protein
MKKKIALFILPLLAIMLLTTCDNFGTIRNTLAGGRLYFQSEGARSLRSVDPPDENYDIEFLVNTLYLVWDVNGGQGVWLIQSRRPGTDGPFDNAGWYDVAGINQTKIYGHPLGRPHSNVLIEIAAIRIGDNIWRAEHQIITPFPGNKEDIPIGAHVLPNFALIAGDKSKMGPGFHAAHDAANIPFRGINNILYLEEFIILVDESKVHTDGVLNSDWYTAFSFSVR